jgi:hypothetical protein
MATQTYPGDTRFFDGWVWLFEDEDNPRLGLCVPGETVERAVEDWLEGCRRKYWLKGREVRIFSLASPDAEPVEHRAVI